MLTNTLPLVEGSKTKPLGLLWLDCSYPVVTRGLVEILREEASIIYRYEPKKDRTPSVVVFCHNGEGVDQEVKRLQSLVPSAPVLILGLHNDPALVRIAIRAGARGFIHLGMQSKQIVRALALASEGEIVVPRELIAELIKGEESPDLLVLTTRQREILNLVGEGLTNAQIAERLFLSEYTVKQHLRAAYKLLGVRNRTEAARLLKTSA